MIYNIKETSRWVMAVGSKLIYFKFEVRQNPKDGDLSYWLSGTDKTDKSKTIELENDSVDEVLGYTKILIKELS